MSPLEMPLIVETLDEFLYQGVDRSSRLWALMMYGNWRKHVGLGA